MHPRDDVIISYGNLGPETQVSGQVCPSCKGGKHAERSMSVGKTGAFLWWKCHRASCGFRGKHSDGLSIGEPRTHEERKGVHRVFKRTQIPTELLRAICGMYGLDEETPRRAGWSYTSDYAGHGARVIFPIYSPEGRVRGEQFRSYSGDEPKAFTCVELVENAISWYRFRKYAKVLVIVEDIPSAVRIAQSERVDALALLGTTLNFDRVMEIREQGYRRVWLALDKDATAQSIKAKREFDKYLPGLMVKVLEEDVKDMSPQMYEVFINECTTNA